MLRKSYTIIIYFLLLSCSAKPVAKTSQMSRFKYDKSTNSKIIAINKTVKRPVTTDKNKQIIRKPIVIKTKPIVVIKDTVKPKPVVTHNPDSRVNELELKKEINTEQDFSQKDTLYSKPIVLEATSKVKITSEVVLNYINQFKEIAKSSMYEYGIPASITLAQGILESGCGTGNLSVLANNHFGIKCNSDWTGESVRYDDDLEQECFRKYEYPSHSYSDHSLFLSKRPRYVNLFQLDKTDYKGWAMGLKAAGYATDPKYPSKLIQIIERYSLNKYDLQVLGIYEDEVINNDQPQIVDVSNNDSYIVAQGDTLYSISKKFNISIDDIKKKNNMEDFGISIGQSLIIK